MPDDESLPHEPEVRDERIGALLAVEPLDDVTRRRLVNTAIRSTGTARQARRLIAAAAVVVVLVAGAGVVVAVGGGGDTTSPTAARDKAEAALPAGRAVGFSISAAVRDVGDFGDLDVGANVDRLRRAFDSAVAKSAAPTDGSTAAGNRGAASDQAPSDALVTRLRALGCSPSLLPAGTVVGLASGVRGGHPVIVVDLQSSGATHSFRVIETDTCTVHLLS
jgi:hypothetical protein